MIEKVTICKKSFTITGRGIIIYLEHKELGLPRGTILLSREPDKKWQIDSRVFSYHTINVHKRFENETINYEHFVFNSIEKKEASIQQIKKEEANSIYQYFIKPIDHNEKPIEGQELILEFRPDI